MRIRTKDPDFSKISKILKLSLNDLRAEWPIFMGLPETFASSSQVVTFLRNKSMKILFPNIQFLLYRLMLLPIGTASVERSFSTMNRILTSERFRLLPGPVYSLMKISIEGPDSPDLRAATKEERDDFSGFLNLSHFYFSKVERR